MYIQQTNLDAQDTLFFNRELETIDKRMYEVKYPNRQFAEGKIIPITKNASRYDKKYTYRMYDRAGIAKIINNYGKDLPRVTVKGKEESIDLKDLGDSFGYTEDEIQAARQNDKPLEMLLALAARAAIAEKLDAIGQSGDAEYGINGLKQILENYATEVVVPADGSGSSKLFTTKSFLQIIRDLNALVFAIVNNTDEAEIPNTLLVPLTTYSLISTTYRTNTDNTVEKLFLATNPYIKEIIPVYQLETMGSGGTRRMVAYDKNPDKISFEIPVPLERQNPQLRNYEWINNLRARTGGVFSRYPLSLAYADGI